jgi:SAM-dependent methyltransferase
MPKPHQTVLAAGVEPASRRFGVDRGQPLDRHYIAAFLAAHRADIRGVVLEVGGSQYTRQFGRSVTRRDVLAAATGPAVTVVGDLTTGDGIPGAFYDCFICTQTLPFLPDPAAALRHAHKLLRPGGVLLLTVPGISQVSRYDADRWGDFWRFMPQGLAHLLTPVFGSDQFSLEVYGNVRVAAALLDGRAVEELTPAELNHQDPDYPVLITARAVRTAEAVA